MEYSTLLFFCLFVFAKGKSIEVMVEGEVTVEAREQSGLSEEVEITVESDEIMEVGSSMRFNNTRTRVNLLPLSFLEIKQEGREPTPPSKMML